MTTNHQKNKVSPDPSEMNLASPRREEEEEEEEDLYQVQGSSSGDHRAHIIPPASTSSTSDAKGKRYNGRKASDNNGSAKRRGEELAASPKEEGKIKRRKKSNEVVTSPEEEEKIRRRKESNLQSAIKSRNRRRQLLKDAQEAHERLAKENIELQRENKALRSEIARSSNMLVEQIMQEQQITSSGDATFPSAAAAPNQPSTLCIFPHIDASFPQMPQQQQHYSDVAMPIMQQQQQERFEPTLYSMESTKGIPTNTAPQQPPQIYMDMAAALLAQVSPATSGYDPSQIQNIANLPLSAHGMTLTPSPWYQFPTAINAAQASGIPVQLPSVGLPANAQISAELIGQILASALTQASSSGSAPVDASGLLGPLPLLQPELYPAPLIQMEATPTNVDATGGNEARENIPRSEETMQLPDEIFIDWNAKTIDETEERYG